MMRELPATWRATATATNGTAATTEVDDSTYARHYVTHLSFSVGGTGTQTAGGYLARLVSRAVTVTGAAVTNGGNTATSFRTNLTAADDTYNGLFIRFLTGNNAGAIRTISDFAQTNGVVTVGSAFSQTPVTGEDFEILTDTALMNFYVTLTSPVNVNFTAGYPIPMNTAVYADIAGTGNNVISTVNIAGYSL